MKGTSPRPTAHHPAAPPACLPDPIDGSKESAVRTFIKMCDKMDADDEPRMESLLSIGHGGGSATTSASPASSTTTTAVRDGPV
ncbi:unnamed protein product, partial [Mesorhabditis spiculigera]